MQNLFQSTTLLVAARCPRMDIDHPAKVLMSQIQSLKGAASVAYAPDYQAFYEAGGAEAYLRLVASTEALYQNIHLVSETAVYLLQTKKLVPAHVKAPAELVQLLDAGQLPVKDDPATRRLLRLLAWMCAVRNNAGKIVGALEQRGKARVLRRRLARCVLVGDSYEQKGWWYLSAAEADEISRRIVALGDEVAAIDGVASHRLWHAAQLVPVLVRCRRSYDEAERRLADLIAGAGPRLQELPLSDDRAAKVCRATAHTIEARDTALDALFTLYQELIAADQSLARLHTWLRLIDRTHELPTPVALVAARDYAGTLRDSDLRWTELSAKDAEVSRIRSIAIKAPPPSDNPEIELELPRRNLDLEPESAA